MHNGRVREHLGMCWFWLCSSDVASGIAMHPKYVYTTKLELCIGKWTESAQSTHKIRSTSLFRSTPIIIGGVRRAGHTDCSAWTNRPTWTNTTESTYTLNVCCVLCCAAVVVMWCEMMLGAAGWYWAHASPTKLRCDVCMAASCTIAHNHIQFDVWLWQPKRERERESEERCADMYVEWVHRQFPDVYMKWE